MSGSAARPGGGRLLAVLLAAVSSSAVAEWTPVTADNGIYAAYADRATLHREGSVASMRGMYDFPHGDFTPGGLPFSSTVVDREYDCGLHKVRLVGFADHFEHAGEGRVVSASSDPRRWEDVVEDSLDEKYWRIACEAI